MTKKISVLLAAFTLLICGACSGETAPSGQPAVSSVQPSVSIVQLAASPTPIIIEFYDHSYLSFYTTDLSDVIENSDTIVLARVEKVLPAERRDNDVYTPANIKVIESVKGDYISGDVFMIDQFGGVAGGIDFRPASMNLHEEGETYLFFINNIGGNILDVGNNIFDSEHVTDGDMLNGYFFNGKTTDEAISIINVCIKNGKVEFDIDQIVSFSFVQMTDDSFLMYSVDKTGLKAQITHDSNDYFPSKTEEWDLAKWDSFISDLNKCGVFDWDGNYGDPSYTGTSSWRVDFGCIGYKSYGGTNSYPDEWKSFMKIIDNYMGSLE